MYNFRKYLTDTRITGLLYLGLAITGLFIFAFAKGNIYISGDPALTKSNMIEKETLARFGLAAELGLVIFQTLTAVWFYKIFSKVNSFAAGMVAVFGVVNAIAILISSTMWLGALNLAIANEAVDKVYNLFTLHELIWVVSGLFFGLWLIPMGYLALNSKMPRLLGWILITGGIGYILSTFIAVLFPNQKSLIEILPMIATVGEFWMIGYLLSKPKLHKAES